MSPPKDAYQIGWICALPIEVAAAKQMLDETLGMPDEQDAADTNSYTLGRIGKHYVVIAGLPGGQYGIAAATAVAINMMRTFSQSLRIGLMVGIGGGIPSAENDIRLGDIVVSQPEGTCGGVLQYDLGKEVGEDEFVRVGSLNSPPQVLLTAVANMRATALTDDPKYPNFIKKAIKRNTRTRKTFRRPDKALDRLIHFEHTHPTTADTCEDCPLNWDISREFRDDDESQIHYGIIASGNRVMKYGPSRERLRQETGALCFEMEAAGLMMNFPCIVVRGICDYADSHKNKQWQGYAALAAAAYTKELLSYVPTARIAQEHLVQEICNEILEGVKSTNKGIERAIKQQESHHRENKQRSFTKEQQECHQVFKTSTYEQFKDINPTRVVGTCRWILDNPQYLDWVKSNRNDLLWISADPGCGKSVLARSLIDVELKAQAPNVSICYFFFKDNDEQNSLATALCAIIHQLFATQPNLLRHAQESWQKNGSKIQQEVGELWRIIEAVTFDPAFCNTICILDALDECHPIDQHKLIHNLNVFYAERGLLHGQGWLKFLITSRPYDVIMEEFLPTIQQCPHVHVPGEKENVQIREEISLVVKSRVSSLGRLLHLSLQFQQMLEYQLIRMEHRTYLWLHLAMDDLRIMLRNSLRPEKESIQLIPRSVEEAYIKILDRVPPNRVTDVKTILCIIVGARRPLTIEEMAIALGLANTPSSRTADEATLNPVGLSEKIRQLCGLFVFVNNSRIYLIHQTAREFLLSKTVENRQHWIFQRSETEDLMSQICINYLLLDDIISKPTPGNASGPSLLEYCAEHWADHVRGMSSVAKLRSKNMLSRLYDISGPSFAIWFPIFWGKVMPYQHEQYERMPKMNAIRLAAFNGHDHALEGLLCDGENAINEVGENNMTALHWASERGHVSTVQLLLDNGADSNAQGGRYGSALQAASKVGNNQIILALLENGANINAQGGRFGSALQVASSYGHSMTVQMLLDRGADINIGGGYCGNALHSASASGHVKIVEMLLHHGANVNRRIGEYDTALQAASYGGFNKIVQILIDKGADINVYGGQVDSALQAASYYGHIDVMHTLLDNGADVNMQTDFYGTALIAASNKAGSKAVQILLDKGADVNMQSGFMSNALQSAAEGGDLEVLQILLDKGADINRQAGYDGTALQAACYQGHLKVVEVLLDKGADINTQGGEHGSALQAACYRGHLKVVEVLLDKGADINTQGGEHGSALQAACYQGHLKVAELLLDKGADINTQGGECVIALQAVSNQRHADIKQMLLERGATITYK